MNQTPGEPDRWRDRVRDLLPGLRTDLEALAKIPSVSADSFDPDQVAASAEAVAALLAGAGLQPQVVRAEHPDGRPGHPAVIARRTAPPGRPTVLLYAHHDVQPPGDPDEWHSPPFVPTERDGRLYGRGTADDKAGVLVHVGTLRALLSGWGEDDGVGIVVFVEGEEEAGSGSLPALLERYHDQLQCDVIIVADSDNWTPDDPSLTVSLRGLVMADVEVATLPQGLHSGLFGGAVPDAVMALTTLLARLWDEDGTLAVPGLEGALRTTLTSSEQDYATGAGLLPGVRLIGRGPILDRVWNRCSLTVTGIDVPPVQQAANVLLPAVRARLVLRVAPDLDPQACSDALRDFLLADPPFGATVEYRLRETGQPFAAPLTGPVYDLARQALGTAFGRDVVEQGVGGSIPFIADLAAAFPEAAVLATGVEDPRTHAHAANESLHLGLFEKACLAEILFLDGLAAASETRR